MARGFMSGALWGGVVGLGVTSVASLMVPLPASPVVSDAAPGAAQAPARIEQAGSGESGSQRDRPLLTPQVAPQAQAPEAETSLALDTDALTSAQAPQTGQADDLAVPSTNLETATLEVAADSPVLPNPLALAPMEPQPADDLSISTEPAAPPPPSTDKVDGVFAAPAQPVTLEGAQDAQGGVGAVALNTPAVRLDPPQAPQNPVSPGSTQDLADTTVPAAPTETAAITQDALVAPLDPSPADVTLLPQDTQEPQQNDGVETALAPVPQPEADTAPTAQTTPAPAQSEQATAPATPQQPQTEQVETASVQAQNQIGAASTAVVRRRIGTPSVSLTDRDTGVTINRLTNVDAKVEEATEAAAEDPTPDLSDLPPLQRHVQAFENAEAKPLMSIVLIDDGSSVVAGADGIAALRNFPYPLSFAVDASLNDAADRMAIYRAEGLEVMAMINLPEGAQPSDAETTLGAILPVMDEVVGVLEGTNGGLQGSRDVADQVTAILAQTGHGLITQDKGLNTMPKLARKAGVPADPVFRDFDSKGQSAQVIRRFLDQAAFKAGQEGAVVMLGRLRPDTISALTLWGLQDRASKVALAPVSALLLREE